jgi:hypothetical protein
MRIVYRNLRAFAATIMAARVMMAALASSASAGFVG